MKKACLVTAIVLAAAAVGVMVSGAAVSKLKLFTLITAAVGSGIGSTWVERLEQRFYLQPKMLFQQPPTMKRKKKSH